MPENTTAIQIQRRYPRRAPARVWHSPQRASLHSQLQQDGQGQVLVLQGDTARPFGGWCPMNVPEMTAAGGEQRQSLETAR